jgi:hypothetical protein
LYGGKIGDGYVDGINGAKTGEKAEEEEDTEHDERSGLV